MCAGASNPRVERKQATSRDLVYETATEDLTARRNNKVGKDQSGSADLGGHTSGPLVADRGEHGERNADWLRVIGLDQSRPITDGLVCILWVVEQDGRHTWSE